MPQTFIYIFSASTFNHVNSVHKFICNYRRCHFVVYKVVIFVYKKHLLTCWVVGIYDTYLVKQFEEYYVNVCTRVVSLQIKDNCLLILVLFSSPLSYAMGLYIIEIFTLTEVWIVGLTFTVKADM